MTIADGVLLSITAILFGSSVRVKRTNYLVLEVKCTP
jgi:hypothetical protein